MPLQVRSEPIFCIISVFLKFPSNKYLILKHLAPTHESKILYRFQFNFKESHFDILTKYDNQFSLFENCIISVFFKFPSNNHII
jgi:hypothetical protein